MSPVAGWASSFTQVTHGFPHMQVHQDLTGMSMQVHLLAAGPNHNAKTADPAIQGAFPHCPAKHAAGGSALACPQLCCPRLARLCKAR